MKREGWGDATESSSGRPQAMNKGQVLLLSTAHFVNDSYAGFLAPLLPLLVVKFSLSLAAAGFLSSVLTVSSSLSQPLYGYLSDRLGRRYFVVLGPLLTAVFMSSLGLPDRYIILVAVVFAGGMGTAFFHPQGAALAGLAGGDRKGFGMSLFSASGNAGYAAGPLFIVFLVSIVGLREIYVAVLPGLLISLVLYKRIVRAPLHSFGRKNRKVDFKMFRPLLPLWSVVVIRALVVTSFATFIPLLLDERGHSLIFGGTSIFIFLFCGACGGLLGGYLSDRIGRKVIILLSLISAVPFFFLFLFSSGVWAAIGLGLAGLFLMSSIPVVLVMAQELLPGRVGTVSGLMMGFGWGIGGLGVSLAGMFADSYGLTTALAVVGVFPLIGFGVALFLPRR